MAYCVAGVVALRSERSAGGSERMAHNSTTTDDPGEVVRWVRRTQRPSDEVKSGMFGKRRGNVHRSSGAASLHR